MDWKEELAKLLVHRKIEDYAQIYWNKLQNAIIPSVKDIQKELLKYHVNSDFTNNRLLSVPNYGFTMEIALDYDKIKITSRFPSPIEPDELPPLKPDLVQTFSLEEITEKLIGDEFIKGFKTCSLLKK